MAPDIEVVFDLPVGTHRPRHPASQQLDVEVQRMRRALVFTRHDATRPGGSAVEALELLEVHRTAGEGVCSARCWCAPTVGSNGVHGR